MFLFNILIIIKLTLHSPICKQFENHCKMCNPITKLCEKCDKYIFKPDKNGGCEGSKKCILGKNQCLECNEEGNLCINCIEGYFPDENGGCSYSSNCEISDEGKCLKCKENFILVGLDNYFYKGITICKSTILGDFKNCEKIDAEKGVCYECKNGFFLTSEDHKCISIENCNESTFDLCTKCNNGYYLDKKENKCKSYSNNTAFRRCQETVDGKVCDICEEEFYFDANKKCTAINYCEKSSSDTRCEKCIEGYYLTEYGSYCTPEINCHSGDKNLGICISCKENYYIDLSDGKCKSNKENNEFKYCSEADEGKCKRCVINYVLGLDNRCSLTNNCSNAENGKCIECIENYYLGKDNKCSNIEHCIYSNLYYCIECEGNYYFDGNTQKCLIGENKFKNCKSSSRGDFCEECKNDFYLNMTNKLCYSNEEKNNFYKCSKTDNEGKNCYSCITGYYLGEDNKCSRIEGCKFSENEDKCIECDNDYYCLDVRTGKCEPNDEVIDEKKKFYFRCNMTNEEGNKCALCQNKYDLDENGLCVDNFHCEEKDEEGNCKKCINEIGENLCLNKYFGCVELFWNNNCLECNNVTDFYICTKCLEGYEPDDSGYCITIFEK